MRDIWFVDSPDAQAFHLFPDCPALEQAVQPIVAEEVSGLARLVRTERFGDLSPCARCRQRIDAEQGAEAWEERLDSVAPGGADAFFTLLGDEEPSAAMLRGDEPLRVFKQNFEQLQVFTDRLEIKRPALLGGESSFLPFTEIRELRPVSWIPLLRPPAIEIDVEIDDGEIATDSFEFDIRESPGRIVEAVDALILSALSDSSPRRLEAEPAAPRPKRGMDAMTASGKHASAKSAKGKGRGSGKEREELARLYDEAQELGGAVIDEGSGADLTKTPLTGDGFAQFVLDGCNSAEDRKNLADRLEEAVRFARFMAEANANPLTKPKRWAKLVVSIGGCDIECDMVPTSGPAGGAGSGAGAGGGGGGRGRKSGPVGPGPGPNEAGPESVPPTDKEWAWLKRNFPNMKRDEIAVTGPRGTYNCLSLVLGVPTRVWKPGVVGITRDELDGLCAANGWVDSPDGDIEIAIWGNREGIVHVSRILPDGRHESKLGVSGYQVIHFEEHLHGGILYRDIKVIGTKRGSLRPPP